MSTPSQFLAKGALREIPRYFQVGLGLGAVPGLALDLKSWLPGLSNLFEQLLCFNVFELTVATVFYMFPEQ